MKLFQILVVFCVSAAVTIQARAFEFTTEGFRDVDRCSVAREDAEDNDEIRCLFGMTATSGVLLTATTVGGIIFAVASAAADARSTNSLIDEAYQGDGESIRLIAQATRLSVDQVSDTIVALDVRGKLDPNNPKQTAKTISKTLNTLMAKKKNASLGRRH